ncbi:MAG: HNH endonuclease [Eubacterium sp.]|nr:HNH endonuclease [Eubacterium sp.]
MTTENYVYKKEVDWSVLHDGLTLPFANQVEFGKIMGRFLARGESKEITIYLDQKAYKAKITNVNFDSKFKRKKDTLQIRYSRNGDLAKALQASFQKSYRYIKNVRENRDSTDRTMIKVPDEYKEYLAIYTTEYDDSYIFETIVADDMQILKEMVKGQQERVFEADLDFEINDETAGIKFSLQMNKIRKLSRKIGDNLKLLYGYRCQICGKLIGEEFGSHIAEAHHIDYFINSLNNDADNQLIVCPNHHRIIHDVNPVFDRSRKLYIYENGMEQKLVLNKHL